MRRRKAIALWAAAIAYAAAIFAVSSLRLPESVDGPISAGDKALHALEYGVFALLFAMAFRTVRSPRAGSRAALIAFLVAVVYGVTDEIHQAFVPGRVGDLVDLAWDIAGAAVAAGGFHVWAMRASRAATVSETSPR